MSVTPDPPLADPSVTTDQPIPDLDLSAEAAASGPLSDHIVQLAPATGPKSGLLTTEFWLVLIGNALANTGAVDVGGGKQRGLLAILSVVAYTISRGLAKAGGNS